MLAIGFLIFAIIPRLRSREIEQESTEHATYFGHLKELKPAEIERRLRFSDPLPQLAHQLKVMSDITWTKHKRLRFSIFCGGYGLAVIVGCYTLASLLSGA